MSNGLPITAWAREPILWLDQDFDNDQNESSIITPAGAVNSLYDEADLSWQFSPVAVAAASCVKNSEAGHNGVHTASTAATANAGVAIVWTGETGTITTGRILPSAVYRWDWWVKTDGVNITNYALYTGLSDDWTNSGPTATNVVMVGINVGISATNFFARARSASGNQSATLAATYAANTWYKLSAVQTANGSPIGWDFLVNDVYQASLNGAFSSAPVMPGAAAFAIAASARVFSWDRCRVWTDGTNML